MHGRLRREHPVYMESNKKKKRVKSRVKIIIGCPPLPGAKIFGDPLDFFESVFIFRNRKAVSMAR
jgi:hypothetical protein